MERILVIVAHADDEALGCGGLIASEAAKGSLIEVVFLTNGVGSRGVEIENKQNKLRREASWRSAKALGISNIHQLDFPDNMLDSLPLLEIVQQLEVIIAKFKPDCIITHNPSDLNIDHKLCFQATLTASRPLPGRGINTILACEILSSTEWAFGDEQFSPNWFYDISDHLEAKLLALNEYEIEMRNEPHPRTKENVTRLARLRGATVGLAAAEAYTLVRAIKVGV